MPIWAYTVYGYIPYIPYIQYITVYTVVYGWTAPGRADLGSAQMCTFGRGFTEPQMDRIWAETRFRALYYAPGTAPDLGPVLERFV